MSRNRAGINVGEGAALFILRKEPAAVALLGAGASSDAHHISSPDPSGAGAEAAMRAALAEAGPDVAVGYLNLHATATPKNDEMESRATDAVFPAGVACSGTKPLTGHLLGAAAATELAFCWLLAQEAWNPDGLLPPHRWDGEADRDLPALALATDGATFQGARICMSNAFAFGGNNLSLILGPAR
jgi:3-oxoacyl-[acyl-carrier-protein] synthase-1